MQRQTLLLILVGALVVAALLFMSWAATRPIAPAAEAPTAVATVAPPLTTPAAPAAEGIITTELFTMTLPPGWQYTTQQWAGEQTGAMAPPAQLVTAWQGGTAFEDSPLRFSIAALPRHELALEQYVIDVIEQFSRTTGVSAVTAAIVTDLRRDGLPAALVSYTLATPAGEFTGHQAAALDAAGTQLIIATLAQRNDGADSEPLFRTLIDALHFLEPATAGSPGG